MSPPRDPSPIQEHALDAIVVVPGIMGSVLKDTELNRDLWGFESLRPYVNLWRKREDLGVERLALTKSELEDIAEGRYRAETARVRPAGLLPLPSFVPFLGGFEPYTNLVRSVRRVTPHADAVLEFAYDWRLPVRLNSRFLAAALKKHLAQWRAHPKYLDARRVHPGQRNAGIVIIAHSMGGLLVRGLGDPEIEDGFAEVRQVITLGTPFSGSVKSAVMMRTGAGTPLKLPRERLSRAVRTMPGLYDLLPRTPCLLRAGTRSDVVTADAADFASIGGDPVLIQAAQNDFDALHHVSLPGHRYLEGIAQPTPQSFSIRSGEVDAYEHSYRFDEEGEVRRDGDGRLLTYDDKGDGTVWRYAARPRSSDGVAAAQLSIAQDHGALSRSNELVKMLVGFVTDQGDLGVRLGEGEVGLNVTDMVEVGERFEVRATGEVDPVQVECTVTEVDPIQEKVVRTLRLRTTGDGDLVDHVSLQDPGLYRVAVKAGAAEPVTRLVMVLPPEE